MATQSAPWRQEAGGHDLATVTHVENFTQLKFMGTMEELEQGSLHTSIKHPERDMPRPGFEPPTSCTAGGHSTEELS
jgi:hypothetical protein